MLSRGEIFAANFIPLANIGRTRITIKQAKAQANSNNFKILHYLRKAAQCYVAVAKAEGGANLTIQLSLFTS